MALPRTVLVINPHSQSGTIGRKWPHLAKLIRRELGAFEEAFTAGPGDATRLAREAVQSGADFVVAMGGDGTINEVVNGFFIAGEPIATRAALGILPYGTGGDFRKTLGLPTSIEKAAAIIRGGHTRPVDVGKLELTTRDGRREVRMFANIASFGLSGVTDRFVNHSTKRLGGKIAFYLATARANLAYSNKRVRITFDGNAAGAVEMIVNTVTVANGRYFGGGMLVAPDAEPDDGYFDVVALGDLGLKDLILHGHRIYKGTHLGMDKVSHRRARVVHAEPAGGDGDPIELDVDGETPGILPATFTVLPRALAVVVPSGSSAV